MSNTCRNVEKYFLCQGNEISKATSHTRLPYPRILESSMSSNSFNCPVIGSLILGNPGIVSSVIPLLPHLYRIFCFLLYIVMISPHNNYLAFPDNLQFVVEHLYRMLWIRTFMYSIPVLGFLPFRVAVPRISRLSIGHRNVKASRSKAVNIWTSSITHNFQ